MLRHHYSHYISVIQYNYYYIPCWATILLLLCHSLQNMSRKQNNESQHTFVIINGMVNVYIRLSWPFKLWYISPVCNQSVIRTDMDVRARIVWFTKPPFSFPLHFSIWNYGFTRDPMGISCRSESSNISPVVLDRANTGFCNFCSHTVLLSMWPISGPISYTTFCDYAEVYGRF